jgi:hypothetical protein
MSKIAVNGRVYVADIDDFAYKQRELLGIKDSALILADTGVKKAYIGIYAKQVLYDPETKKNSADYEADLPLDWRQKGMFLMSSLGIPIETQTIMFNNFIAHYNVDQRRGYINIYNSIDHNDPIAEQAFVNQMVSILTG